MSFSSFLLGADGVKAKGKTIDTGLDDLFRSTAAVVPPAPAPVEPPKTAPVSQSPSKSVNVKSDKKRKAAVQEVSPAKPKKSKTVSEEVSKPEASAKAISQKVKSSKAAARKEATASEAEASSSDDDEVALGEGSRRSVSDSDSESDDDVDPTKLVHESVAGGSKSKSKSNNRKAKFVPTEETSEQRDARTVFVGNVPVDVVTSKPLQKQLDRHLLSFVPEAKIESTRFRSVAFQKPTTQLPSDDPSSSKSAGKQKEKEGRQHDRDRAASWRAAKSHDNDDEAAAPPKVFLTPKEKKRIAFIKQEIHSGVDSVNAYVVFAHPIPTENWPKNLPPPKHTMDPYEAAKAVIKAADGSEFLGRTLRLDSAVKGKGKAVDTADVEMAGDPKATVFVGNLDFACKEQDVRAFFEGLIVAERGAAPEGEGEGAGEKAWVERVRIIRDKDTLLGKGFGYVQFMDRECVDEILALEEARLKFAKRKLRVQRCKTLPGAAKVRPSRVNAPQKPGADAKPGRSRSATSGPPAGPVPKGDPRLGEKIATLSKEERKKVKATDADRVARRLAKKKAKALAEKGVKSRDTDNERVRKRPKDKKGAPEKSKSKKRVRSDKALSKMNKKKQ